MSRPLYDKTSQESILAQARQLLGKSLHDLYPAAKPLNAGKGDLGQCVEVYHFGYDINGNAEADFKEAGLELKCTPLKTLKEGSMVSKERLVLNIINYIEEFDKTFKTSSFSQKNALLLLMFYLHVAGVNNLDLVFKIIRLWHIPDEDLKIFMDDWNVIHKKIVNGLAHELSEGDTLYLAACVKGTKGGKNKKLQKVGGVLADQRAYSIKSAYLNHIVVDSLSHPEMFDGVTMTAKQKRAIEKKKADLGCVVKSVKDYKQGETFEQLVERRFAPYVGMTVAEIASKLNRKISLSPKAISYSVCRAILGVKEQHISEFEKSGLLLKTIRLEQNGNLKEAMSFQTIKYKEIVNEDEWEESDWYGTIAARRFLFIVFRKREGGSSSAAILERVFFWSMPRRDIETVESFWRDTRDKVRAGDYNHFLKTTEHPICHVRPKAKNAADMTETPQGGKAKKLCYWLNRDYVLNIVNEVSAMKGKAVRLCIDTATKAAALFREAAKIAGGHEGFFVLPLDSGGNTLSSPILVSIGLQSGMAAVDPKEVFKAAIKLGADAIIVAHNHPSGNLTPSKADLRLTEELKSRAEWLGLEFVDHIILGSSDSAKGLDFVSLAESLT